MGYKSSMAIEGNSEFAATAAGDKKIATSKGGREGKPIVPAKDLYMPVFCPAGWGL
jgi:hypothetical protein